MHLIQEDGSMMHNLVCKNMSTVILYLNLLYFLLTKKKKFKVIFFPSGTLTKHSALLQFNKLAKKITVKIEKKKSRKKILTSVTVSI